jgi:hypothetical protein
MNQKDKETTAQFFRMSSYMRKCPMCGHLIDLGQPVPCECALVSLTSQFRDSQSYDLYVRSGICQDCQDTKYGRVD